VPGGGGSGNRQRVDDSGPQVSRFPNYGCGYNPFALGSVWGIDHGWATGALGQAGYSYYGYYGGGVPGTDTRFNGPDGTYTIHVSIPQVYIDQFGINPNDATVNVNLTVKTKKTCSYICTDMSAMSAARNPVEQTPGPRVPIDLNALVTRVAAGYALAVEAGMDQCAVLVFPDQTSPTNSRSSRLSLVSTA
jgi:hypothetical protein